MAFYDIPASLDKEIVELEALIDRTGSGDAGDSELKAHRVPFGAYEQRRRGAYMVRIRCPGGAVTPGQLKAVAELSNEYGSSFVHVTTRQELQIHDVRLADLVPLIRALRRVGLTTRGGGGNTVRNIMASWDSGIADHEVFDVTPYAVALTNRLIAQPDSWLLPRKFKISFSNSGRDNAYATLTDAGFIAVRGEDGTKGFRVYVAGGMGRKPAIGSLLHEFVPASDAYRVAEAVKRVFARNGNRRNKHAARLRFLWRSLGRERFVELYEREYEVLGRERDCSVEVEDPVGARCDDAVDLKRVHRGGTAFENWKRRYVLHQSQPGLYCVTAPLLLGTIEADRLASLADFAAHFGEDSLRATMSQNFTVRNIPEGFLGNAYDAVRGAAELCDEPRLTGDAVACAGADTCQLGICRPRGALKAVRRRLQTAEFDSDAPAGFKLNFSGCSNTCGQHVAADLGFFGRARRKGERMCPAYTVVAGAVVGEGVTRMARELGTVCARNVPEFVTACLRAYLSRPDRPASFAEYVDSGGDEVIGGLCEKYGGVPDFDDDKNYYYDWGATEPFSLAGRGAGECSAGLFDLIELDLERIRELRSELGQEDDSRQRRESVYLLALASARMLLITRGVEASSEKEVFSAFTRHFVRKGLVSREFGPLVGVAERGVSDELARSEERVLELSHAVEALYHNMDNSLHFAGDGGAGSTVPQVGPAADTTRSSADVSRDLRGVACPMNFVKTKLELSRMEAGRVLEVLLDDGEPVENVPRSARAEGHEVVEQERRGRYWAVRIRKA